MLSFIQFAAVILFTFKRIDSANELDKPKDVLTQYKDVFIGSLGGKPQLGTTAATCWARGGSCLHIRFCTNHDMDVGVPGCTTRFKVCCKNFKHLPPTVGVQRSRDEYDEIESSADVGELYGIPRVIATFKI